MLQLQIFFLPEVEMDYNLSAHKVVSIENQFV